MHADLVIKNARELVTVGGGSKPKIGAALGDLEIIENGWLACKDGAITAVGSRDCVEPFISPATKVLDASDRVVMPGFVDCHTHAIFAGSREHEMVLKIQGKTYLEILKAGGGIHYTVRKTREASTEQLVEITRRNFDRMLEYGTTTVEVKTGYGLSVKEELRLLAAIRQAAKDHPISVAPTLLAHVIPSDVDRNSYVKEFIEETIPQASDLAEFCDVYCEEGAFTVAESEAILSARKEKLIPKIHSGQFHAIGATGMAAKIGAISADHLDYVDDWEIDAMRESGTIAVFLPACNFYLRSPKYPDVKRFIERDVPIALATDFNPGSAPTWSMPFMLSLACLSMKLHPAEAITAATQNAACAINRGHQIGSLEVGKQADILLLDTPNIMTIPYFFAVNPVKTVIKGGSVIR